MEARPVATVLVGVTPGMPDSVITTAAEFARRLDAQLVCGYVDVSQYPVETLPDGSVRSMSVDSDLADVESTFPPGLLGQLAGVLDPLEVRWSTRYLAGDPAQALSTLAERMDAGLIVVGTRDSTMRESMREFFNGSVAVHLAHRQHRPVLVVPVNPASASTPLPWESD